MNDPHEPPAPPPPPPPYRPPAYQPPPPPPPAPGGWGTPPPGYGPPPPPPYEPGQPGQPRRSRVPLVLAAVVALVVVAAGITLYAIGGDDDPASPAAKDASSSSPNESSGSGATTPEPGDDLSAVVEYDDLDRNHVTDPVDYPQSPPVGGDHYGAWAECGVYDEPLPDEVATHDLEHGTFWFAYDAASLDDDAVAALADQLPDNGIMSPYEGLSAPVVVTVWGRQLALTGPDDPRLGLFLQEYDGGTTAPEPFASCAGGLSPTELDQVAEQLGGGAGAPA